MVRETQLRFLARAGTGIGMASTKAFTMRLATLYILALTFVKPRGYLNAE